MSDKRYTASDIKRLVGMDRNTLFYCVKTLGLITPAQELEKVTLYDFRNMLDLALIHEFLRLGLTQGVIKGIMSGPARESTARIWEDVQKQRKHYEKSGAVLFIKNYAYKTPVVLMMTAREAIESLSRDWFPEHRYVPKQPAIFALSKLAAQAIIKHKWEVPPTMFNSVAFVDILNIVRGLEYLTGEKL